MAIIGSLVSHSSRKKAFNKLTAARFEQRRQQMFRSLFRRRQFLAGFRQAQAEALTAGTVGGLSIDSSAFRGTQESLLTQRNVGIADDLQIRESNQKINLLTDQARELQREAEDEQLVGDTFETALKTAVSFMGGGG